MGMATVTQYSTETIWYTQTTSNTSCYWAWPYQPPRYQAAELSPGALAAIHLAGCREVSLDSPTRLRPQVRGMKLECFAARNRRGSSGRPGYRRRRSGGVVRA